MNTTRWLLAALLVGPTSTAWAATIVKCVDRVGNITYTETRCPPEQALDKVMQIHNDRPSGDGPAVPLATPRPPEPPQPQEVRKPQPSPQQAPEQPVEEQYDDNGSYGSSYDYYNPGYIHRPRPRPPYPDHYPPPHPPRPLPPPHPVEPPRPAPQGVGAPRNATKHTGPSMSDEEPGGRR
ncbi:hypothetical protein NVV93_05890 [Pseudomonas sp. LS44]|uniref:hypothetical protein n=1 Tax=Pseudomonas sp. LS44 TaxID=1357074 RepID=UPI00215A3B01|nr:hypothetical protein [Pseudomonas sp. LS44]UVE18919.1 hypothetical protein NVV93_05890 [Pseudomonas sp. LS44]